MVTLILSEKNLERLKKLRLLDDDYSRIVFQDVKAIKKVLEIILDTSISIIELDTQVSIDIGGGRTIICDICILSNLGQINVEIENHIQRATPKRIRYHVSALDTYKSKPNMKFKDIEDIIIIFICAFDPFRENKALYHVKRIVEETNELFEDGIQIILVNGSYIGSDDIGKLMHDFRCSNPNEMYYDELKERSKYLKETNGGHKIMCEVWQEIKEEGREEGKLEKLLESISSLMKSLNISLDKAMELLLLNDEEKQYCINNLCD